MRLSGSYATRYDPEMHSTPKRFMRGTFLAFGIGAGVPAFWGILGMLLFNVPEGLASRVFWSAVYITCPFWVIEGPSAIILMPLLNGCLYALLAFGAAKVYASLRHTQ